MPEVVVKYKGERALKALQELTKVFDITIQKSSKETDNNGDPAKNLPITYAKNPDITALAGVWEGRNITLDELRKDAWGERI